MKTIKNKELAELPVEELNKRLAEIRVELMKDNAQVAMRTVPKSPGLLKANKKMVARILTLLNAKTKTNMKTVKKVSKSKNLDAKKKEK